MKDDDNMPTPTILRPALVLLVLLTLLTGVAYPLLVTGAAQLLFPAQAAGSLITRGNTTVGSSLVGQSFTAPRYFWGRPSATGPMANNAAASSGSNQGPLSPALVEAVQGRIAALRDAAAAAGLPPDARPVPVDLVSASASGLDPHISPAAAAYQVARVARVRQLDAARVQALVDANTEGPLWAGLLGEPRVNVLRLNLALDAAAAR